MKFKYDEGDISNFFSKDIITEDIDESTIKVLLAAGTAAIGFFLYGAAHLHSLLFIDDFTRKEKGTISNFINSIKDGKEELKEIETKIKKLNLTYAMTYRDQKPSKEHIKAVKALVDRTKEIMKNSSEYKELTPDDKEIINRSLNTSVKERAKHNIKNLFKKKEKEEDIPQYRSIN